MSVELMMLGAFGVLFGAVWLYSVRLLQHELALGRDKSSTTASILEKISEVSIPQLDLSEIKEEFADILHDLVQDSIGNMQMPTATDHIMGAVANIIQHKFTSSIPPELAEMIPTLNEGVTESFSHGPQEN
jgi:acyl carrier protein